MVSDPHLLAQRIVEALPAPLRDRDVVRDIALRMTSELLHYGVGILSFPRRGLSDEGLVQMLCEDLEASLLLSDRLAPQEDEEEVELTPEQRMARVLDKAEAVQSELAAGDTLQKLIRKELADTDCGACDHPTCDAYSIALANGKDADNTKCEPGGPRVTAQVELVMTVGRGDAVDPEKILAIEALARDSGQREGGLRILEIGTGTGFPAMVFSQLFPDVRFDVLEADLHRTWFLKRLTNVLMVRNCRTLVGRPEMFVDRLAEQYDLVFVKHAPTADAVLASVPFVRPGGVIVNWQDRHWSEVGAAYQHSGPGRVMPLQAPLYFKSEPIAQSVLLLIRRPEKPADEGSSPDAGTDASTEALAPDADDSVAV
jgi:hypothetical protein